MGEENFARKRTPVRDIYECVWIKGVDKKGDKVELRAKVELFYNGDGPGARVLGGMPIGYQKNFRAYLRGIRNEGLERALARDRRITFA